MVGTISKLDFKYDSESKRFRYTNGANKGKFLSREASLSIINRNIESIQGKMSTLVDSLYDKRIDLDVFIIRQADLIKDLHILKGIVGAGGTDKFTPAHIKLVQQQIKNQFDGKDPVTGERFGLKQLVRELSTTGDSEARLKARIGAYAESGNLSQRLIEREVKKASEGVTEARRTLNGDNHCTSCLSYSDGLWKSIKDVILPGFNCECGGRCKCTIEYR